MPGQSRLFLDFCAGALRAFLPLGRDRASTSAAPRALAGAGSASRRAEPLARRCSLRSPRSPRARAPSSPASRSALFGGPLFTPFKAATAIARARKSTAAGQPHVAIFWLASEDHDFAEINHVTFPAGRELAKLTYAQSSRVAQCRPAASSSTIPSRRSSSAPPSFSAPPTQPTRSSPPTSPAAPSRRPSPISTPRIFAAQGLLIVDAAGRDFHRLGAPVLRAAIERADEFHAALAERSQALEAAGYHAQVAVAPQSSLLFLIDDKTGARIALQPHRAHAPPSPTACGTPADADLFHSRSARHSRRRARAHFARGAAASRLSGFSVLDLGAGRRPGGDRLPCAVDGALRAHSRPPDAADRALLRHAHRAVHRRAAAQARALARAGLRRRERCDAGAAPRRALHAHRDQAETRRRRQRPRRRAQHCSSNGCSRRTRDWASPPRPRPARCATR